MFPLKNKLCTEGCRLKVYNESKRIILSGNNGYTDCVVLDL